MLGVTHSSPERHVIRTLLRFYVMFSGKLSTWMMSIGHGVVKHLRLHDNPSRLPRYPSTIRKLTQHSCVTPLKGEKEDLL